MAEKQVSQIRQCFFKTVFSLLGHMAKCDGNINAKEIRRTRVFMEKMELTPECKVEAQELFNVGASPGFDAHETLEEFQHTAAKSPSIVQILLVYLISMATTDGPLRKPEMDFVQQVAAELGYNSILFDHLLKMIAAQDSFTQWQAPEEDAAETRAEQQRTRHEAEPRSAADQYLAAAFKALNITAGASDEEIKKAYRKLVGQFHPDKLVDQGLPPELLRAATDRFRTIRTAYEYIKKHHLGTRAA